MVFGVPGGQTLGLNYALQAAGIHFVHMRHENNGATAADAYGRLTGEPGICLATTGPGATNLLTGIGGALRDSSPMIAFVFQNNLPDVGRGDAQEADHELLFSGICKKYIQVRDAKTVTWAVREAYRTAKTGRPGPVVVDLFRDVTEVQKAPYTREDPKTYCWMPDSEAPDETIEAAVKQIKASKKIAVWAGNGTKISHAEDALMELSGLLKAPIVTTYNGMACVESDFPNLIGPRSRHGSEMTKAVLEEADCIIAVGTSMSSIDTDRWTLKLKGLIQFDIEPELIGHQYPVRVGVVGDAKRNLKKLIAALGASDYQADASFLEEMLIRKKAWEEETFSGEIADTNATPVPPIALQRELGKYLKEDEIFVVDAGNPGAWTHITHFAKGTSYIKPVNFGNMGFAMGAAVGCKEAAPEREVIALIGDGSLGMTLAELETMAREKLNIIVLLVNDGAYGNIKQEEKYQTGKEDYTGVDFIDVSYVNVAKALGCDGTVVHKASGIGAAMEKARASKVPFMIEVMLDGRFSVWPSCF